MLTYSEYYNRMQSSAKFMEASATHIQLNVSGLNREESLQYVTGRYMQALSSATLPSFSAEKCVMAIEILVYIKRHIIGERAAFDFAMFSPEEAEQDTELEQPCMDEYIAYTRMSPPSLVGAAASVSDFDQLVSDPDYWCDIQASILARYLVAHDIDIARYIQIV